MCQESAKQPSADVSGLSFLSNLQGGDSVSWIQGCRVLCVLVEQGSSKTRDRCRFQETGDTELSFLQTTTDSALLLSSVTKEDNRGYDLHLYISSTCCHRRAICLIKAFIKKPGSSLKMKILHSVSTYCFDRFDSFLSGKVVVSLSLSWNLPETEILDRLLAGITEPINQRHLSKLSIWDS